MKNSLSANKNSKAAFYSCDHDRQYFNTPCFSARFPVYGLCGMFLEGIFRLLLTNKVTNQISIKRSFLIVTNSFFYHEVPAQCRCCSKQHNY